MTDGKQLETLVQYVESVLVPKGFEIETRERVLDNEGRQIAEFDVTIRGKVGSTDFTWLIECRDRPSEGAAPGSWIEPLVGRRDRFALDKVTAVSTTGFATGIKDYAASKGIELREVRKVSPAEFNWLGFGEMTFVRAVAELKSCRFLLDKVEGEERVSGLRSVLSEPDTLILRNNSGIGLSPQAAFRGALQEANSCFVGLTGGTSRSVRLRAEYLPEDRFAIATANGPVEIPSILFAGELRVENHSIPLGLTSRYDQIQSGEAVSQMASFGPIQTDAGSFSLELHRMGEDGVTHVVLRRVTPHSSGLSDKAAEA